MRTSFLYPILLAVLLTSLLQVTAPASSLAQDPVTASSPLTPAGVITVNTAADGLNDGDGYCSLREAITAANMNAAVDACPAGSSADTIAFAIGNGVVTITLGSPLPIVSTPLTIDGSTQPGFSGIPLVRINFNNTVLGFNRATNVTVKALDLSYYRGGLGECGLRLTTSTNVTVTNVIAANRISGVYVSDGQDIRVLNSDLRRSGWPGGYGIYMVNVTEGSLPGGLLVRGNRYGDSSTGIYLQNAANLTISDGRLPGSNVVITATSGLNRTSGTALFLSGLTNVVVDGLDLSYTAGGNGSYGLYATGNVNLTVNHLLANNRKGGVKISGGRDVRVLNSDLRRAGWSSEYGLYAANITAGSLPGGLLVQGNRYGDSSNGVYLQNIPNLTISDGRLPGSQVIITPTSGLNRSSDAALYLSSLTNATVDGLDLSYIAGGNANYGLYASNVTGLAVRHVTAANRVTGIYVSGGQNIQVTDCDLSTGAVFGTALYLANSVDVTVARVLVANRSSGIVASGGQDIRVLNSDLRRAGWSSGYGLYVANITAGSLPGGLLVQGNRYGDSSNGVYLQNIANLAISDGRLPGSQVIITPTSGLNRTSGTALNLGGLTNVTVDGLDLSYIAGGNGSYGLYAGNNVNMTLNHLLTNNRRTGISIGWGRDARVLNSDLRRAGWDNGYGLYVYNVSAGSLPGGLLARGNRYGDSNYGVHLQGMPDLTISDGRLIGSQVIITNSSGLTRTADVALDLFNVSRATITGLDVSYGGAGSGNYGLRVEGSTALTATYLVAARRSFGIELRGCTAVNINCSVLCVNSNGVQVNSTLTGTLLADNWFQGNSTAVRNVTTPLVGAENNYWGAADGPSNLGGLGDPYAGNVDASPFLTMPPECAPALPPACLPTAAELLSFTATAQGSYVLVAWETASEVDTVGFNLYRREAGTTSYTRTNDVLIPSRSPGSGAGASYTFSDENVQAGVRYEYLLEEIETDGRSTRYGPVAALARYTIWLPVVIK